MVNPPSGNRQGLSSTAGKLVSRSARSPLLAASPLAGRSLSSRMREVLPQPVRDASLVVPTRIEPRHLAWMLEHIAVDATGDVIVPVDADARPVPRLVLPDPVPDGAGVGFAPAGPLQQYRPQLHVEPLG